MQIIYKEHIKYNLDSAIAKDNSGSVEYIELTLDEFKAFYAWIVRNDAGDQLTQFEYNALVANEKPGISFIDTVASFVYRDTRIRIPYNGIRTISDN